MIVIILGNIFVIISLFICSGGSFNYLTKIIEYFKKGNILIYIFYFLYFLSSLILALEYLMAFNLFLLWGESPSNQNLNFYSILIKSINSFTLMSYLMLGIALLLELSIKNSVLDKIWKFILLSGSFIFILTFAVNVEVVSVENNFGLVQYNPSWIINLSLLYPLIIGISYGIQIVKDYSKNYRTSYGISLYHNLFIIVISIAFFIIFFGILIRLTVSLPADIRSLIFVIVTAHLLVFPSLRWIYIDQYHKRAIIIEKERFQDMINHDLSNITQIMMSHLEFLELEENSNVDIESLMNQVKRMNQLIEKSRESFQSEMIQ